MMNNEILLLILVLVSMAFVFFMLNKANKPVNLPAYKPTGFKEVDLKNYSLKILLKNSKSEYVINKLKEFAEISELDFKKDEIKFEERSEWLICSTDPLADNEDNLIRDNFFSLILWLDGSAGEINKPDISFGIAVSKTIDGYYFYCIPDENSKDENVLIGAFTDGKKFYYYIPVDLSGKKKNRSLKFELIFSIMINIDPESFIDLIKNIDPKILNNH
jgi:hypothetical protein